MTFRHLKIFLTVAECGKMRRAAEMLYISQPAVSQAIKELEDYYGVKLFDRLTQKLYLTDMGQKLLPYARKIVNLTEDTDKMMKNKAINKSLRLGASVSVGSYVINSIIDKLDDSIDVSVVIDNTSEIERLILNSELDVAIVEGSVVDSDVKKIPLFEDELVMVVGKSNPFYQRDSIYIRELDGQDLIARENKSTERNQYEQLLESKNIYMNKKWICTNIEAIKNAVMSGRGIGILSMLAITKETQQGTLKILNVDNIKVSRDINLIYHKDKFISQLMKNFIYICENFK